jgi:hypothetical protein
MLFAEYTQRQSLPLNTVTMIVVQASACRAAQWTARPRIPGSRDRSFGCRAVRTAAQACGEIHGR